MMNVLLFMMKRNRSGWIKLFHVTLRTINKVGFRIDFCDDKQFSIEKRSRFAEETFILLGVGNGVSI